jgi:hypothetical protein
MEIRIPDEAVEALRAFLSMYYRDGEGNWISEKHAHAAITAALAAWPKRELDDGHLLSEKYTILLPMSQEPRDDNAPD